MAGVSDEDVFHMQERMAVEEGLWIEPVSAVPVAALADLLDAGTITSKDKVICILSGAGFKDDKLGREKAEAVVGDVPVPFDVEAILSQVKT